MSIQSVTQRFIVCYEDLQKLRAVKSARQFALSLGCLAQNFGEMRRDKRAVTVDLVRRAVEQYGFNPTYIFMGEGAHFLADVPQTALKILRVSLKSPSKF